MTGKCSMPSGLAGDGIAGFGLPPMVDDRNAKLCLGPLDRVGIGALAGKKKSAETRKVVFSTNSPFGIFAFDGAEGGWGGEKAFDVMLFDDAPERACVGVPTGLPSKTKVVLPWISGA